MHRDTVTSVANRKAAIVSLHLLSTPRHQITGSPTLNDPQQPLSLAVSQQTPLQLPSAILSYLRECSRLQVRIRELGKEALAVLDRALGEERSRRILASRADL